MDAPTVCSQRGRNRQGSLGGCEFCQVTAIQADTVDTKSRAGTGTAVKVEVVTIGGNDTRSDIARVVPVGIDAHTVEVGAAYRDTDRCLVVHPEDPRRSARGDNHVGGASEPCSPAW